MKQKVVREETGHVAAGAGFIWKGPWAKAPPTVLRSAASDFSPAIADNRALVCVSSVCGGIICTFHTYSVHDYPLADFPKGIVPVLNGGKDSRIGAIITSYIREYIAARTSLLVLTSRQKPSWRSDLSSWLSLMISCVPITSDDDRGNQLSHLVAGSTDARWLPWMLETCMALGNHFLSFFGLCRSAEQPAAVALKLSFHRVTPRRPTL